MQYERGGVEGSSGRDAPHPFMRVSWSGSQTCLNKYDMGGKRRSSSFPYLIAQLRRPEHAQFCGRQLEESSSWVTVGSPHWPFRFSGSNGSCDIARKCVSQTPRHPGGQGHAKLGRWRIEAPQAAGEANHGRARKQGPQDGGYSCSDMGLHSVELLRWRHSSRAPRCWSSR